MIRFLIHLVLTTLIVLSGATNLLLSQELTGTSTLTVTTSGVYAYGVTQADYGASSYYDVGASVALFSGSTSNIAQMTFVDQDNELAQRDSVNGSVSMSFLPGQYYAVETAHYLSAAVQQGTTYIDYFGYSSIPFEDDNAIYEILDVIAPNFQYNVFAQEIDIADTYVYGGDPALLMADPILSTDAFDSPIANGDGTYTATLSAMAFTDLEEDGFVDAATIENALTPCPPPFTLACEVVIGGAIVYEGARILITTDLINVVYNKWKNRVQAPIPFPGMNPNVGPPGWPQIAVNGNGEPVYGPPGGDGGVSVSPDLNNEGHSPHWDYNDRGRKPKNWRLWPDGTMTPK